MTETFCINTTPSGPTNFLLLQTLIRLIKLYLQRTISSFVTITNRLMFTHIKCNRSYCQRLIIIIFKNKIFINFSKTLFFYIINALPHRQLRNYSNLIFISLPHRQLKKPATNKAGFYIFTKPN